MLSCGIVTVVSGNKGNISNLDWTSIRIVSHGSRAANKLLIKQSNPFDCAAVPRTDLLSRLMFKPNPLARHYGSVMKSIVVFSGLVVAATLLGCAPKTSTKTELTQIYDREKSEYERTCQNRDEQVRVIEELEKLDRAMPASDQKKPQAEIEQLEALREKLNEEVKQQAVRVASAKHALDEIRDQK
jgi:hypothetical protein